MLCKSCLQDKEPSAFYASNRTKCKECVKEAVRTNRLENIEHYRAFDRMHLCSERHDLWPMLQGDT